MSLTVTSELKDYFFDRDLVMDKVADAERRAMAKIGAYIRNTARRKVLRRRKRASAPGSPPSVHSRDNYASLKNILFGFDRLTHSVLVGPVLIRQSKKASAISSSQTVPELLEFGGTVTVQEQQMKSTEHPERWYLRDMVGERKPWVRYRTRQATYERRRFMSVALEIEIGRNTIAEAFRASIG